jgi:hypothetical protein
VVLSPVAVLDLLPDPGVRAGHGADGTGTDSCDASGTPPGTAGRRSQRKELLKVLERRGEINAAPETSLSVSEADKMLSRLAKDGHLQVRVREGTLTYAMWE